MIKSKRKTIKAKHVPSPRLSTVKMVENSLENMDDSIIKVSKLKKILPKQVNHNTLMEVLDYLEKSNKILFSSKGIIWLVNDSPKFQEAIRKSHNYDDIIADLKKRGLLRS
jgi:sulfur transfer complex TusBCD TusB component (DsrH family)